MIVLDSSVVYALLDASDRRHAEAATWYSSVTEELVTSPLVLGEVDHLARTRLGPSAAAAFRADVVAGAYLVEWWPRAAALSAEVADRYSDSGVSLADGSLVALADRAGTTSVATFDLRHFRLLRPLKGSGGFTILPDDA